MNTLDFTKFLKTKGLTNIYPNNLPAQLPSSGFAIGVYGYSSTMDRYIAAGNVKYQFVVVATDLNVCEAKANEIMNQLNELVENEVVTDFFISKLMLLQIAPMYFGVDESNRYQFKFNVEMNVVKL